MSIKYQVASSKTKIYFVFALFSFLWALSTGHKAHAAPQLSEEAYISLITCGPGKELYSAFGHSALRVHDPAQRIDRMYNYGTFDFDQPNFYSNYAKGRPIFTLSVSSTRYFVAAYVHENRSVVEDVLNLTSEQKQHLFDLLEENYQPENREYRYDYIYDNCATRIRDMLVKVMGPQLAFDPEETLPVYTFRQLMDLYLEPQPWGDLGIDLALSSVIDTPTTPYYYMFLPDFLQKEFQHAQIWGYTYPLPVIEKTNVIYQAEVPKKELQFFTPLTFFWLLFLLYSVKTAVDLRKEKISFAPDVPMFVIIGLMGIIIAYISFFSDHHAARNYNLLWAIPTHLLFALLLPFIKKLQWVKYYFLVSAIITGIALIGGLTFIPQQYNAAFYPLMLMLIMRSWVVYRKAP